MELHHPPATPAKSERLNWRMSLAAEDNARRANERGTLVRLVGEFHLHLAQLTGNPHLVRLRTELEALICLAILLYASGEDACPADEHRRIFEAILGGDGEAAAERMLHHLNHIEADLRLDENKCEMQISEALDWLGEAERSPAND